LGIAPDMSEPPAALASQEAAEFKQRVHKHFHRLLQAGSSPNEAAVQALEAAQAEAKNEATQKASTLATWQLLLSGTALAGKQKYGELCLGLVGPFQSICVVGEPRLGKKLLVLDIDHTIYDPSQHAGCKGSVVRSDRNGFYDESTVARCRPGLQEFLTEADKDWDIMIWSASDMTRILTLLQQLGIVGAGHSDYKVLSVLDIESMSEFTGSSGSDAKPDLTLDAGALVQTVTVPDGVLPGQQIEVRSISDGSPIVVAVPAGLKPGDTFHMTVPGAVSSISNEFDVDADDVQLALQLSMGIDADAASAPISKSRKRSRSVKPLSLIWACSEFSSLYSEKNTVIIDDTIDVCSANPQNSIQCTRYYWKDHATDTELARLSLYLAKLSKATSFPQSHKQWRDGL